METFSVAFKRLGHYNVVMTFVRTFVLDEQLRGVLLFMKQDLLELIEKLSENEIAYLYEFAHKLFS